MSEPAKTQFVASLEGIRGYAFLVVFLVHYSMPWIAFMSARSVPLSIFSILSTASVPMFFVLSGYLITDLLSRTAEREGFFRVYYWRRALRIVPAYYVALALALGMALWQKVPLHPAHLLLLIDGQNMSTTALGAYSPRGSVMTGHLWSMGVEEQFYLAWPVVMFLLPTRKQRLAACYIGIAAVNFLHFSWPVAGLDFRLASTLTPMRADALLMGSALALHRQGKAWRKQIRVFATWTTIALPIAFLVYFRGRFFLFAGNLDICGYRAIRYMYPCLGLIGLGIVVAALEEDSWFKRLCEFKPACYLGRLSYGLYLFHVLYLGWFWTVMVPWLLHWMRLTCAVMLSSAVAFAFTLALAMMCYRWVEIPALRYRFRLEYGSLTPRRSSWELVPAHPTNEPQNASLVPAAVPIVLS